MKQSFSEKREYGLYSRLKNQIKCNKVAKKLKITETKKKSTDSARVHVMTLAHIHERNHKQTTKKAQQIRSQTLPNLFFIFLFTYFGFCICMCLCVM